MAGLFWALLMVCCLGVRGQEAPLPPGLSGVDAVWELTAHFPTEDQSVFLGLGEKMALDENWIAPPGSPDASHDERLVLSYGTRYFTALVLSWKSVATSPQRWTILLSQPEDSSPCQLSLRLRRFRPRIPVRPELRCLPLSQVCEAVGVLPSWHNLASRI